MWDLEGGHGRLVVCAPIGLFISAVCCHTSDTIAAGTVKPSLCAQLEHSAMTRCDSAESRTVSGTVRLQLSELQRIAMGINYVKIQYLTMGPAWRMINSH